MGSVGAVVGWVEGSVGAVVGSVTGWVGAVVGSVPTVVSVGAVVSGAGFVVCWGSVGACPPPTPLARNSTPSITAAASNTIRMFFIAFIALPFFSESQNPGGQNRRGLY